MLKLIALFAALLFSLTIALTLPLYADDVQPTCDQLAEIYHAENVPVDYSLPYGWDWVKEDMERVAKIYLGGDSTLEQWREAPARRLWIAHYFNHDVTEVNGILGLHNLCMFRITID